MFIGKYYHTLEEKGRISLPKAFRDQEKSWVVTRGLDGSLFLFPHKTFKAELSKLQKQTFADKTNRDFVRLMTNEAALVKPDKNGRVQLPEYLIEFAKLVKKAVIVGSLDYIELWDQTTYHRYMDSLEPKAAQIAQALAENKHEDN